MSEWTNELRAERQAVFEAAMKALHDERDPKQVLNTGVAAFLAAVDAEPWRDGDVARGEQKEALDALAARKQLVFRLWTEKTNSHQGVLTSEVLRRRMR